MPSINFYYVRRHARTARIYPARTYPPLAKSPALNEGEKKQRFKAIQDGIHVRGEELQELFALFGEPPHITPTQPDKIMFRYPLGDVYLHCSSLVRQSHEMKGLGAVELDNPWSCHPTGEWEQFDHGVLIAHFSLDRVPGSDFNQIVIRNIHHTFPPRIIHETFDLLDESVQRAILEKVRPQIPTPEQSAEYRWKDIERDNGIEEWRKIAVSLQASGEAIWRGKELFIGPRRIALDRFRLGRNDEVFTLSPGGAVQNLIEDARRMLAMYLDPLDYSFVPKKDEPLLGIPSVKEWRARYVEAFNKLKEAANWNAQDADRVRSLDATMRAMPANIIGHIDLVLGRKTGGRGSVRPSISAWTRRPATPAASIAPPKEELKRLEVDQNGWFTCDKGHKNRLGQYGRERLKNLPPGEQIKLKCDGCNACVGYYSIE